MTGRRDGLALAEWELSQCRKKLHRAKRISDYLLRLNLRRIRHGAEPFRMVRLTARRAEVRRWRAEERRLLLVIAREAEAEATAPYWRAWCGAPTYSRVVAEAMRLHAGAGARPHDAREGTRPPAAGDTGEAPGVPSGSRGPEALAHLTDGADATGGHAVPSLGSAKAGPGSGGTSGANPVPPAQLQVCPRCGETYIRAVTMRAGRPRAHNCGVEPGYSAGAGAEPRYAQEGPATILIGAGSPKARPTTPTDEPGGHR